MKKARKKLRLYVESHSKAIRDKAEIMVDHFLESGADRDKLDPILDARVAVYVNDLDEDGQKMPQIETRKLYHLLSRKFNARGIKFGRDGLFAYLSREACW